MKPRSLCPDRMTWFAILAAPVVMVVFQQLGWIA
jgi:hypothetical protein